MELKSKEDTTPDVKPLVQDLSKLTVQLDQLSLANTAVDEALRRGATVTPTGSLTFSRPPVTAPSGG
jgi:hypothetical protein